MKLNTFYVFRCLIPLTQFLQRISNKSHFELPHSALDNGVPRLFVVCAGPMILVNVNSLQMCVG